MQTLTLETLAQIYFLLSVSWRVSLEGKQVEAKKNSLNADPHSRDSCSDLLSIKCELESES
jgi:hypothetical protein